MSSKRWKTAASMQRKSNRYWPSSMRYLTSTLWKKRWIILKTGSPDLGPTWPEVWRKTKGRHRSLGAVLLCLPTETMREICWQSTHFEKEASMVQSITYQSETKTVPFQGKTIVLESLTPVLSPKEKEKRKKEIERCLYEVFSKYRVAGDKRH